MQLSALSMHEHIQEDGEQSPVMHTSSDRNKLRWGGLTVAPQERWREEVRAREERSEGWRERRD